MVAIKSVFPIYLSVKPIYAQVQVKLLFFCVYFIDIIRYTTVLLLVVMS